MKEKDITSPWTDPDDAPKLDADWFEQAELREGDKVVRPGRPRLDNPKQPVSLRLDQDVVAWFKSRGEGWQTRMNEALRKAAGL
jgi:uncharacterized protein (DUF4415 family)